MSRVIKSALLLLMSMVLLSCKEEYIPKVDDIKNGFLVVEGMLNNGDLTTIRLSRTRPLDETIEQPELNASVSIQNENSQSYALSNKGGGVYTIALSLDKTKKYRIYIRTTGGNEYASDFVPVMTTPVIDHVTWEKKDTGLDINVDTHDPGNNTRYYRWAFEETWIRNVPLNSQYEYINRSFQPRRVPTQRLCYDTNEGSPLTIASTAKLSQDVVSKALVNIIPAGSHKLADKYSILVKQYALEKKAYEYWQSMKKNTEQLGSIFDPQPSYMYGNIRSVNDPNEIVIGYFGACNVTEKRIFITAQETNWVYIPSDQCDLQIVEADKIDYHFGSNPGQLRWIPIVQVPNSPNWYGVPSITCADCGSNYVKPVWWQ